MLVPLRMLHAIHRSSPAPCQPHEASWALAEERQREREGVREGEREGEG